MKRIKIILVVAALLAVTVTQAAPPTKDVKFAWNQSPDAPMTKLKDTLTNQTLALVNTNTVTVPLPKNKNFNVVAIGILPNGQETGPSNAVYVPR